MQRFGLVLLGCLFAIQGWAQSSTATSREAAKVNQQVARHQAEVQRLQQDVSKQESASQQAAQKLQQQDQAIAELRKQIEAARQASKVPSGKH
jgi:septal ring factor EnvC (AmiA/AmiB activator)